MTPLSAEAEALSRKLAELLGQTPPSAKPGVVQVQSRTKAGVFYEVVIGLDGVLTCNCPASFNHLECWHCKLVREDMMTNESTALVPITVRQPVELLPSSHDLDVVNRAAAMAYAGAVSLPQELNSPEKVAAVMLYGLELGLRPMTAIQHLYIVKGKISASAQVMMGICMSREPSIQFHVKRTDAEACTIRMLRPSRDVDAELTITIQQIQKAGLMNNPMNQAYPEDRLRYHCIKRLCRTYAPDLINGLDEGVSVTGVTAPAPWPVEDGDLYNEGDAPVNVDRETGEIREPDISPVDTKVQAQEDYEQTDAYKEAASHFSEAPAATEGAGGRSEQPPSPDEAAADRKEITRLVKELQGVWSADEVQALGRELKQYLPDPSQRFVVSTLDAEHAAAALGHVRSAIAQRAAVEAAVAEDAALEALDEADGALDAEPPHEVELKLTPGGRMFCGTCGEAVDEQTGEHLEAAAPARRGR